MADQEGYEILLELMACGPYRSRRHPDLPATSTVAFPWDQQVWYQKQTDITEKGNVDTTELEDTQAAEDVSVEQHVAFEARWAETAAASSPTKEVVAVPPQTTAAAATGALVGKQETACGRGRGRW